MKRNNIADNAEVNIIFCDDQYIKEYNNLYRGKNVSTDVLSFAMEDGEELDPVLDSELILGDIIISVDTAKRQAQELLHPLYIEIDNLVTHGVLHLLGYDHILDADKKEMFTEHERILFDFYKDTPDSIYADDTWFMKISG